MDCGHLGIRGRIGKPALAVLPPFQGHARVPQTKFVGLVIVLVDLWNIIAPQR